MMKLLLLPLLLLAALIPARSAELELYCTTDLHGHADRLAALGGALRQGGDAVLRVDVGDTAQGTLLSQFSGGRIMIESLNALNFDCWIPGNHDFELGFDRFRTLAESFRGVTLGGEWRWNGLSGIPWKLFRKNGVSAAVIGLSDPKMPHRGLPTDGSRFDTPYAALERIMPEIRAAAPDVVILFWHNGLYSSIGSMGNFLRRFPEIDLVVGGHSHQEHPGERAGHVHFVQTGRFAEAAGRIRITLDDRTRRILRIDSELLRPGTLPDPEVAAAQRPFRSGFDRYASEQVITFPEPVEFPAEIIWNHPFSRLAADAYRSATGAEAAFFAMYRPQSEPFRRLDRAGLFQLLPYESRLCAIRLDHE
ncbi:MAG: bifunctional metallophosphatase/5'-nucleotidase, partial [Victivallis vadensis]